MSSTDGMEEIVAAAFPLCCLVSTFETVMTAAAAGACKVPPVYCCLHPRAETALS